MLFKRERSLRKQVADYFHVADGVADLFEEAMKLFLDEGRSEAFMNIDRKIHGVESRADDMRIQIEKMMYRRSLLPESRGDLLGLLEHFDRIPNVFETLSFMLSTNQVSIPDPLEQPITDLVEKNLEAYRLVRQAVDLLFEDPDDMESATLAVDVKESESDDIEGDTIRKIFCLEEIEGWQRILLGEFVRLVGDISDHAERVAHRLQIISLKRKL